jgi:hypothetical protein
MKREVQTRYLVALTAAAALFIAGAATAADPPQSGQSSSSQQGQQMGSDQSSQSSTSSSEAKRLSGTIRSIDSAAGTVTVKGLFLSKTFHADASVLQGLNIGDKVDVTYSEQGSTFVASQITRLPESSGSSRQQPSSESPSRAPQSSPSPEPSGSSQSPQP